ERLDAPPLEHPDFRRPERGKDVQAQRLAIALLGLRLDRDRDLLKPALSVSQHRNVRINDRPSRLPCLAGLVEQNGLRLAARLASDPPPDACSIAVIDHVLASPLSDAGHFRLPYASASPARALPDQSRHRLRNRPLIALPASDAVRYDAELGGERRLCQPCSHPESAQHRAIHPVSYADGISTS